MINNLDPFLLKDIENMEDTRLRDSILEHMKKHENTVDDDVKRLQLELDDAQETIDEYEHENWVLEKEVKRLEKEIEELKKRDLENWQQKGKEFADMLDKEIIENTNQRGRQSVFY
jgi:peptidoglycan hydrolase CwlO-like protein